MMKHRVRRLIGIGVVAIVGAGCERRVAPAPRPFVVATSLHSTPLGSPPGQTQTAATAIPNPFEGDPGAVARGEQLFGQMNCVYCHGVNGVGLIGPPLDTRGWRYGGTPAQIYNSIHDGRPQGMPAWGETLPPQEIWRLVSYIESLGGALPPAPTGASTGGASARSSTGEQVADQSAADAANAGRRAGNAEPPR
jgi:cytochrome c oxidase cbb3-type subunit 3